MSLRDNSSRSSRVATTGSRPTNSGIRPYFKRSPDSTSRKISPVPRSSGAITLAPKPIELDRPRAEMIFSSPLKAPPHTNRIFVVSTCRNSCCGCLRPPCGGTEAMVPSMILSSACCTPSPDTSRVIDGLSDLRLILSISSEKCAAQTPRYPNNPRECRANFRTSPTETGLAGWACRTQTQKRRRKLSL
jgi:hypothetical protein